LAEGTGGVLNSAIRMMDLRSEVPECAGPLESLLNHRSGQGSRKFPAKEPFGTKIQFGGQIDQHFVLPAAQAPGFESVVVEPASAQPKGPAQFSATIAVRRVMEPLSHLVELLGSWPKMAKAFFKMSRWRLTAANSRSSCAIRLCSVPRPLPALWPCWPY
jgi:hypothetical protein